MVGIMAAMHNDVVSSSGLSASRYSPDYPTMVILLDTERTQVDTELTQVASVDI